MLCVRRKNIYPSIHLLHHLSYWVTGEPVLGDSDTLDRMPVYLRAQSHTHSHNLEMLISLQCLRTAQETWRTQSKPQDNSGITCRLHTGRNQTLEPGGARQIYWPPSQHAPFFEYIYIPKHTFQSDIRDIKLSDCGIKLSERLTHADIMQEPSKIRIIQN